MTLDIPLLSDLLPENWEYTHKCRTFSFEQMLEGWRRGLTAVGLDQQSLADQLERVVEHHGRNYDFNPIRNYVPGTNFLLTVLGEDLTGRRILEVGPRKDGTSILGYLSTQGALGIGLDYRPPESTQEGVESHMGRWENITDVIEPESLDAIYVVYMHPQPERDGPFGDEEAYVSKWSEQWDEMAPRRTQALLNFERHIAVEMAKVLKPGGFFIVHNSVYYTEYVVEDPNNFTGQGFVQYQFKLENEGESLVVFQKVL